MAGKIASMEKHNGLKIDELEAKGYSLQPDGRLRLWNSWKSQCAGCGLWFHLMKAGRCATCHNQDGHA